MREARSPIRLHGKRVEEMFVYSMAAVGGIRAIKREETDDFVLEASTDLAIPDYRVVLADGSTILVEVKNVRKPALTAIRAPRLEYLSKLARYGELFSTPVYLATYWSAWRRWTLHSVADLLEALKKGPISYSFGEAYRRSEMFKLGDALIGTTPPLAIRFGVTSRIVKKTGTSSEQLMRIDNVDLSVAGSTITTERDKNIAFGLMMHGGWEESENVVVDADRVTAIEYSYSPPEADSEAGFAPVTALSSLASSEFNDLTAGEDGVHKLRPQELPSPPYPRVNEGYYGVDLPIWILTLQPDGSWASARRTGAV